MSNEAKPLLSDERLWTLLDAQNQKYFTKIKRNGPASWHARQVRDLYEAERTKLMAVLQVCADGIDMMKQGSFADTFVFADDAELKAYADGILSQLKAIGIEPNK